MSNTDDSSGLMTGSTAGSESVSPFRRLPAVNELVDAPMLEAWRARVPRSVIVEAARALLGELRKGLESAGGQGEVPPFDNLAEQLADRLCWEERPRLRPVINATGILLHTGLGRSPLAENAVAAVVDVARQYASLELDLDSGERGKRTGIVRGLLCRLTGAESATVVNNNAAATVITLSSVGKGKSILVSRGELIEIGGSFRLPDIMQASGATLREVGTTNKTRIADYKKAIDDTTAGLMKVHTSNYRIVGFSEATPLEQLVALGRERALPVIDDIGSGALVDFAQFGFQDEPLASASIRSGADLVLFSGDKLLGGPQAGIIVGRHEWIDRIEKNPLMRAFRVDKMTLAALEATLRLYRDSKVVCSEVPLLQMLSTSLLDLRNRAEHLARRLREIPAIAQAAVAGDVAYLGGGSIPAQGFESVVVRLEFRGITEGDVATRLRLGDPAVVPRVQDGQVILDLRTIFPSQEEGLLLALQAACQA